MALQVWLPLVKDLNNYGLANVTVTSNAASRSATEGKLGASFSFDGSTSWIKTTMPSTMTSLKNSSVCMWIKSTGSVGAGGGIMHNSTNAYACMCLYTSGWQMATGSAWKYVSTGTFANTSVWHHVACTMDDTTIRTYFDGALVTETTIAAQSVLTDITSTNFIGLGCDFPGGDEYFTGFINDFRVYDHCLSKREVKEISKGLFLHYPLNNNGNGNPNLLPNRGQYYSESTAYSWTSSAKDGCTWLTGSHFIVEPSTTYTFSVCSDGNLAPSHDTSGKDPSLKLFTMWLYLCNSDTTKTPSGGGYDNPVCFTSANYNHQQIGNRHIWQYTTRSTETHMSVRVNNYSNGTDSLTIKYWQIKIEKGDKATPWCPNENDASYSTSIINANIELDTSGYQYHATKVGTLEYSNDTPRNSVATMFADGKYIRMSSMPILSGYANSYTFSWWGKYSSTATKMMWGYQNGNRLNLYLNSSKFFWNTGDSNNNPFGSISSADYLNSWHHFVVTGDGTTTKLYIDGQFKANATTYKAITGSDLILNGWNTANDYNFNGPLSDFRLYATALSATDILELYNSPINFNKHSVMTQGEFVEK